MSDEPRDPGNPGDAARPRPPILLIAGLVIGGVTGLFFYLAPVSCIIPRTHANETAAIGALKTLLNAQAVWRSNDVDKNGEQDHWVTDVAGMYALDVNGKGPVKHIPFDIAQADPEGSLKYPKLFPKGAVPRNGYYFQVFPDVAGEGRRDTDHHSLFAYQAYPAEYGVTGRNMFIMSETGAIWRSDASGQGVSMGTKTYKPLTLFASNPPAATPPWTPAD